MDSDDAIAPPSVAKRFQAVAGLFALVLVVPLAVWTFGGDAVGWVIGFVVVVALLVVAGVATRRLHHKRFPIMPLDPADMSDPAAAIADAKARLASRDYAAFTVNAVRGKDEPEANGQVWFHAAGEATIDKTVIELTYDTSTPPGDQTALTPLVEAGFAITRWEPDHWVLLTRSGDVDGEVALRLIVDALGELFDLGPTDWTTQAYA